MRSSDRRAAPDPRARRRQRLAGRVAPQPRQAQDHHESADGYAGLVARLSDRHRLIRCRHGLQWILQGRRGERRGRARWAALGYFRTRAALIRASHALHDAPDPEALAILDRLPARIGGAQ